MQPEEGVVIGSLRKAAEEHPELIARYYAHIAKTEEDAITALNTMLAQDGLFIYVPKTCRWKSVCRLSTSCAPT